MATCSRCGHPVEFRYINGRCIPLHTSGGCSDYASSSSGNDFLGFNRSPESCCFKTNCPECNDEVFFIRHNGGSVWVDPPLGPPWQKHPCFTSEDHSSLERIENTDVKECLFAGDAPDDVILGVVTAVEVSSSKKSSVISVQSDESRKHIIVVKNNGGFLLGKLAFVSVDEAKVTWCDDTKYAYPIIAIHSKQGELFKCPECSVTISSKNLRKHFRKAQHFHFIDEIFDQ